MELFSNLIENSVEHSDCDRIRITSEKKEGEVPIHIEDDGKGIPNKFKNKIFEKGFKKGETGGSGLGLYLVKEIAKSYDDSIEISDSDLGGARFDVHLEKA